MDEKLLTYSEVAQKFGFKVGTLYALVSRKRIPHVRFSRKMVRFRPDELEQWVRASAVGCDDEAAR